jgi:hypothetical protein
MKNINDFKLTANVTVGQAREWMAKKDEASKVELVELIHYRFSKRYLKHLSKISSGFLKMAISCLTIETLESFRQGRKDTSGKGVGEQMFRDFFRHEKTLFPDFDSIYRSFYSNIRCGILHQAETNNAWRILRDSSPILDKKERTINAVKFVESLEQALDNYISELKADDCNSTIWKNALIKIQDICDNCAISNKNKKQLSNHQRHQK